MVKASKKLHIAISMFLVAALISLCGCDSKPKGEQVLTFSAMDTMVTLKVTGDDSYDVITAINDFVVDYDFNVISRHSENSEISRINKDHKCPESSQLYAPLMKLLSVYQVSLGAYDFTLGNLSDLWGFGTGNEKIPEKEAIDKILLSSGAGTLAYTNGDLTFAEGVEIDLGSAGKGMALDKIRDEYLAGSKTQRAVISLGGSILLYGEGEFTVGIADPENSAGSMAKLKVNACCVSTSGNYERYFEKDGVRYHHILDPKTGYPSESDLVSVTVVSKDGTLSDALSTACFVLGSEDGQLLLQSYECEGVFILKDGTVIVTDGLRGKLEITNNKYELKADYES